MSTPIVETLARAIVTQLETLTKANGYNFDVEEVVRPLRKGVRLRDKLVTVEQGAKRPADEEAVGTDEWIQPFTITLWLLPSDFSETPVDTLVNTFGADVEKAIKADPQWSATVIDSWVVEGTPVVTEDNALNGAMIDFQVNFRHAYGDPYNAP